MAVKRKLIEDIYEELLNLKTSPLYKFRQENNYLPVIGEGSLNAKIIFIGEAPGKKEAETGKPFCGQAGKVLDQLLESIGLDRKKVYITSVIKDRPPKNRDPKPAEIKIYSPFLDRQIEIIKPKVIVTLGRFATDYIIEKLARNYTNKSIGKLHGTVINGNKDLKIVPLYHPAVILHGGVKFEVLKKDFNLLKSF